jgi:hypothetical protein
MTWGALTNAFAQTLFVASLALVVALPVERTRLRDRRAPHRCRGRRAADAPEHLWRFSPRCLPSPARSTHGTAARFALAAAGVLLAAASATIIAVVLYYAWFPSVYVAELGRVASASVPGAPAAPAPVTSFAGRLARAVWFADIYFGWPAMACSGDRCVAAVLDPARRPGSRCSCLVGGASVSSSSSSAMLTPVDMRYQFAAFPRAGHRRGLRVQLGMAQRRRGPVRDSALLVAGVRDGVAPMALGHDHLRATGALTRYILRQADPLTGVDLV